MKLEKRVLSLDNIPKGFQKFYLQKNCRICNDDFYVLKSCKKNYVCCGMECSIKNSHLSPKQRKWHESKKNICKNCPNIDLEHIAMEQLSPRSRIYRFCSFKNLPVLETEVCCPEFYQVVEEAA